VPRLWPSPPPQITGSSATVTSLPEHTEHSMWSRCHGTLCRRWSLCIIVPHSFLSVKHITVPFWSTHANERRRCRRMRVTTSSRPTAILGNKMRTTGHSGGWRGCRSVNYRRLCPLASSILDASTGKMQTGYADLVRSLPLRWSTSPQAHNLLRFHSRGDGTDDGSIINLNCVIMDDPIVDR